MILHKKLNCKVFCDTQEQYIFVHDAVRELLLLGDTTIKAGKMRRVITQLSRMGDDRNSGYQQQFAVSGQIWQLYLWQGGQCLNV